MGKILNDNRFNYSKEEFLLLEDNYKNDIEFVKKCLRKNGKLLEVICEDFKSNKELILLALENDIESYNHIPDDVLEDIEFVIQIVRIQPILVLYNENTLCLDDKMRCNKRVIITAIEYLGVDALWDLCPNLYQDVDIIVNVLNFTTNEEDWSGHECSKGKEFEKSKKLIEVAWEIYGNSITEHDYNWILSQSEIIENFNKKHPEFKI